MCPRHIVRGLRHGKRKQPGFFCSLPPPRPRRGGFWQVVDRVDDAIHLYRDHKATVLVTVGMSVSFHVLQCTVLWLFAGALGGRLAYTQMLLLAPVGFIVNAIPITPGGLGLGETGFQTLLAIQGLTVGGATFLCWRISNLIAVSPGAIIWALHRTQLSEAAAEASDAQEPAAEDPAADPAGEPS